MTRTEFAAKLSDRDAALSSESRLLADVLGLVAKVVQDERRAASYIVRSWPHRWRVAEFAILEQDAW